MHSLHFLVVLFAEPISAPTKFDGEFTYVVNERLFPADEAGYFEAHAGINAAPVTQSGLEVLLSHDVKDAQKTMRDMCGNPDFGPGHRDPDTPSTFLVYGDYSYKVLTAAVSDGYTNGFRSLYGSANSNYCYRGYGLLNIYVTATCSKRCKAITDFADFNIYYERSPNLLPGHITLFLNSACADGTCYW